jgi:hypothetical protein
MLPTAPPIIKLKLTLVISFWAFINQIIKQIVISAVIIVIIVGIISPLCERIPKLTPLFQTGTRFKKEETLKLVFGRNRASKAQCFES